ncbi:butyrophilin-like protein 3 isoform X2 [Rhinolophus ferrumequinum]|uniref:butyrophilin-like protein 3 isoform X2 n=1 Tax=Rhinolophus ferrumequinum TaxID=59479 RepID=UPI00140FC84F|nr:butyrophilin-like protein 3 isoform X2 [Rhinolophus ferrumequinum]
MAFGALVLTLLLSLLRLGSGHWQVMGPDKTVQLVVGEDAVFSCFLSPKISAEAMEVRFFREEFHAVVHLYREGKDQHDMQMPAYRGRTELLKDSIAEGHVSLRLKKVTLSDNGFYGCRFRSQNNDQEAIWEMQVSALGSAPLVSIMGFAEGGIQLLCKSSGWFPQPTVKWKGPQGHDFPSYSKVNTDRRGLFDVETSLIVQGNAGSISCSIQYPDQSREVESSVLIRETFFHFSPYRLASISLGVLCCVLSVAVVGLMISYSISKDWRRKHGVAALREARKHAVEVTLDPDTAHPQLYISDLKTVCYRNNCQEVTYSDKRFTRKCVVASQEFQTGKHYWEVDVGHNIMWCVGVCRDDVDRKVEYETLSSNNGFWVLRLKRQYQYFILNPHRINLSPRTPPTRIGVFLDYEGGTISFLNINDQSFIYTLTHQFEGLLRPYIQHYVNDEKNVTPIKICPVSQGSEKEAPSDTDNLEPIPQVTTPFLPRGNHTSHLRTLSFLSGSRTLQQTAAYLPDEEGWPIHVGSGVSCLEAGGKTADSTFCLHQFCSQRTFDK